MAVILIVTAPMSVLRAFFLAGYTASVPILVGRSQLARANSIFEAIYSFGFIIGPAIAGFLAATIGPGLTLAIDAASFALSSLVLSFMRATCAPGRRQPSGLARRHPRGHRLHRPPPAPAVDDPVLGPRLDHPRALVTALTVHVTRDLGYEETILGLV